MFITYEEAFAQFDDKEVRIPAMIPLDSRIRGCFRVFRVFNRRVHKFLEKIYKETNGVEFDEVTGVPYLVEKYKNKREIFLYEDKNI